jgi:hypothetical protein
MNGALPPLPPTQAIFGLHLPPMKSHKTPPCVVLSLYVYFFRVMSPYLVNLKKFQRCKFEEMTQDIKLLSSEDHLSLFSFSCKREAFCTRHKKEQVEMEKNYVAETCDACKKQLIYTAEAYFLQHAEISETARIFNAERHTALCAHETFDANIYCARCLRS